MWQKSFYTLLLSIVLLIPTYAQQHHVLSKIEIMSSKIVTVQEWLSEFRKRGYKLYYAANQLDLNKLIRLKKETATVKLLLNDILRTQPIDIIEKGDRIFIVRKKIIPPTPKEPKGTNEVYIYDGNLRF
jgi:hypothetical protein